MTQPQQESIIQYLEAIYNDLTKCIGDLDIGKIKKDFAINYLNTLKSEVRLNFKHIEVTHTNLKDKLNRLYEYVTCFIDHIIDLINLGHTNPAQSPVPALNLTEIESIIQDKELPLLPVLEKLTEGNDPVLRKWKNGKYKCNSLPKFIDLYNKLADNLTPAIIRDYLLNEKNENPYSKNTIEKNIKIYGLGRKPKYKKN